MSNTLTAGGLQAALESVNFDVHHQRLFDGAMADCGGSIVWRSRKAAELHDLIGASQISPRLRVEYVDVREALRAVVLMKVPVALRPGEDGQLRTAPYTRLGLTYPEVLMTQPVPGYTCTQILEPRNAWYGNVSSEPPQLLCLASELPAGILLREIILLAYAALSGQSLLLDEQDPAGILSLEAIRWWQENHLLLPLTRAGFLEADEPESN